MLGSAAPGYRDVVIAKNWNYRAPESMLALNTNLLFSVAGSHRPRVRGNVFCRWGRPALTIDQAEGAAVEVNTNFGSAEFSTMDGSAAGGAAAFRGRYANNDYFGGRPRGIWTSLRGDETTPDAFERTGRLLAFVSNCDLAETVELELDGASEGAQVPEAGRQVRVSSVEDPDAYVLRYVAGGKISVPMYGWGVRAPVVRKVRAVPDTLPEFGVFLLQWDVDGEAAPREPLPLIDPGAEMPRAEARAARITA